MKKIVLLGLLFFISFISFAQEREKLSQQLIQYYNNGEYEKAVPIAKKAIDAAKKELGENNQEYAGSLSDLATLYSLLALYEKAEPLLLQATEIRKNVLGINHPDYARSLHDLAQLYNNLGVYIKAESYYKQANDMWYMFNGENSPEYASGLHNLAFFYYNTGEYDKAESLLLKSLAFKKLLYGDEHIEYAVSLSGLGILYSGIAKYDKAEFYLQQAIAIALKTGNENTYATSLNNLGLLYYNIGQYKKAEPLYIESNEIKKRVDGVKHPDYATGLSNLGILYTGLQEYDKALVLLEQVAAIRKDIYGETHAEYAMSLSNLSALYSVQEDYKNAELLALQVLEIRKKTLGENHPEYATSLANLAALYYETNRLSQTESLLLKAATIRKKALGENHPDYSASIMNLALLYIKLNQIEKAEGLMLKSSQITTGNIINTFNFLSEEEKEQYLENNISVIDEHNSFLFLHQKLSPIFVKNNFNQLLFFKSLSLRNKKGLLESVRNNNDTTLKKLYSDWLQAKKELATEYSRPLSERSIEIKTTEKLAEQLEKKMLQQSAAFRNQQKELRISTREIRENLETDEVAIEFLRFQLFREGWTDSIIYAAYILNKNDSVPIFVPLCEENQLQRLIDSAGTNSTNMAGSFYRGLELGNSNSTEFLGTALYKLIWQPLEGYLKGVKKISYSPAGQLYSIAFQALCIDSMTVLMDKYELQQYNSTTQVALRDSEINIAKPASITLFGNASFSIDSLQLAMQKKETENGSTNIYTPQKRNNDNNTWSLLPGTAEEVKKIKNLFDQNKITTKSFVEAFASEENLKALDGNSPQILHIATHGFFLPEADKKRKENNFSNENPYTLAADPLLRSGLILAGGNYAWSGKKPIDGVEDGIATAYEISQLNLSNTELVVLSACETALGDVKGSEGVFGLQRAFKMAGVKKMIVSLWQVPDKETAELMTAFYTYWMKGKTINEAFTQAQADMRKKYSPFYWAAFVLVE